MKRALFLCTGNSCRSQMGEVVMNAFGKGRYQAFSAGAAPAGYVHPMALKVMRDAKFDTEGLRSKSWDEFKGQEFDLIITVCDLARQNCPIWPGTPQQVHWSFEDPAKIEGTEQHKLEAFKKVLGEMQQRVRMLLSFPDERFNEYKVRTAS
jgi:arsenate reductase (thioredoxin)